MTALTCPSRHARQGDFFRGGLGVHIHKNDLRQLPQTRHLDLGAQKRVFQRLQKGAALQIEHRHGRLAIRPPDRAPLPDGAGRIIKRTQKARLRLQEQIDFLLVP